MNYFMSDCQSQTPQSDETNISYERREKEPLLTRTYIDVLALDDDVAVVAEALDEPQDSGPHGHVLTFLILELCGTRSERPTVG